MKRRTVALALSGAAAFWVAVVLATWERIATGPAQELLTVSVEPTRGHFFLDEDISCQVRITNVSDRTCYVVKCVDGSESGYRYPKYLARFEGEDGRDLPRRREIYCDLHFNPLKRDEFVRLAPGRELLQDLLVRRLPWAEDYPRNVKLTVTYEMGTGPTPNWQPLAPNERGVDRLLAKAVIGAVSSDPATVAIRQRPLSQLRKLLSQARAGDANALVKLEENRAVQIVPELVELLRSPDERIPRFYAIRCLGKIGDARAREVVRSFVGGPDKELERIAVMACGQLRDIDACELVYKAYQQLKESEPQILDESPYIRCLATLGDVRATDDLLRLLRFYEARVLERAARECRGLLSKLRKEPR